MLIGFMGAGKSSVGRALSNRLGWAFEDLDRRIEKRAGLKVHEIFRDSGESHFRRLEHEALRELLRELQPGVGRVIALGGGAFVQRRNALMIEFAEIPVIFLDAQVEELWRRCLRQAGQESLSRPLLDNRANFEQLYKARRPQYLKASLKQETGGITVDDIAAELIQVVGLKSHRKRGGKQ